MWKKRCANDVMACEKLSTPVFEYFVQFYDSSFHLSTPPLTQPNNLRSKDFMGQPILSQKHARLDSRIVKHYASSLYLSTLTCPTLTPCPFFWTASCFRPCVSGWLRRLCHGCVLRQEIEMSNRESVFRKWKCATGVKVKVILFIFRVSELCQNMFRVVADKHSREQEWPNPCVFFSAFYATCIWSAHRYGMQESEINICLNDEFKS